MTLPRTLLCLLAGAPFSPALRAAEPPPAPAASAPAAPVPLQPTVIESGSAEMVSTATETTFTFRDGVTVTATNMKLTCDLLVVIARRSGDPEATIGKQENFKSLVATGKVRILQNDREATCNRAEVFPGENKAILTGKLTVRALDNSFVQTGERGILYRGERRAVIEGTATERPRITLPPLRDLGFGKEPEKKASTKAAPADSTAPNITVPNLPPPK